MALSLKGKVYWVKDSVTINTTFNATNNKYTLTVGNLEPDDAAALDEEFNIKLKDGKEEQGATLTAKSLYPFIYKDKAGTVIEPHTIRNGSDVEVRVTSSYPHAFSKKYGNGASVFKEVVVINMAD